MECNSNTSCQAGKGDRPRNCFSQEYRDNYDAIDWNKKKEKENENEKNFDNTIVNDK